MQLFICIQKNQLSHTVVYQMFNTIQKPPYLSVQNKWRAILQARCLDSSLLKEAAISNEAPEAGQEPSLAPTNQTFPASSSKCTTTEPTRGTQRTIHSAKPCTSSHPWNHPSSCIHQAVQRLRRPSPPGTSLPKPSCK